METRLGGQNNVIRWWMVGRIRQCKKVARRTGWCKGREGSEDAKKDRSILKMKKRDRRLGLIYEFESCLGEIAVNPNLACLKIHVWFLGLIWLVKLKIIAQAHFKWIWWTAHKTNEPNYKMVGSIKTCMIYHSSIKPESPKDIMTMQDRLDRVGLGPWKGHLFSRTSMELFHYKCHRIRHGRMNKNHIGWVYGLPHFS